ncbi:MAG: hypothetical protein ACREVA_00275 [Burkholderiales bacterium]
MIVTIKDKQITVATAGIQGLQGPPGTSGSALVTAALISLVWGVESAEVGNTIEITASCVDFDNAPFVSGLVSVELLISDAANSYEPSDTAVFVPAVFPLGTLLSGDGTARSVWQTNALGLFRIGVLDASVGDRYIWTRAGGHERLFVRARDGIKQITFT